jgi:hypothetical protein
MVVNRAKKALKRAATIGMKQAALMAFIAIMPPMWLTYTVRTLHQPRASKFAMRIYRD